MAPPNSYLQSLGAAVGGAPQGIPVAPQAPQDSGGIDQAIMQRIAPLPPEIKVQLLQALDNFSSGGQAPQGAAPQGMPGGGGQMGMGGM